MPEKKHNFTATEIKAGLLVIASLAALAGFIVVVLNLRPEPGVNTYHALFRNTIGLNPNADVRWGGYKVGKVTHIGIDPEDQSQIRVTMSVADHVPVNDASVATIEQISLTAERHLELSTGAAKANPLPPGATVKALTKSGGFIDIPDLDGVILRVENLLDDVIDFLGAGEARELEARGEAEYARIAQIAGDVRSAVQEGTGLLEDVRGVLQDNAPSIEEILDGVKDIEAAALDMVNQLNALLAENRPAIGEGLAAAQRVMNEVETVVQRVAGDLDSLVAALQGTLDNSQDLTGNLGHFVELNRPVIEDIVLELQAAVRNLNTFSRTMAEQPAAVLRGARPEGRR